MRRASPGGRQRASGEAQREKKNNEKKTSEVTLAHFWLSVETEFLHLAKQAVKVLIPFTSTYLCECRFSALTLIKGSAGQGCSQRMICVYSCVHQRCRLIVPTKVGVSVIRRKKKFCDIVLSPMSLPDEFRVVRIKSLGGVH